MASYKSNRVKRMMEEEQGETALLPSLQFDAAPSSSRDSHSVHSPDRKRIKLHFDGRVYRSLSETSPLSKSTKKGYAKSAQLLGAPDETLIDAVYEAIASSPRLASSMNEWTTRVREEQDESEAESEASDLEIAPVAKPLNWDALNNVDVENFILPENFTNLLNLHTALERALMLYLSTEGKAGQIASAVASASQNAGIAGTTTYSVKLKNLATFTALKPIVERASGRRFTAEELAQLMWLWRQSPDKNNKSNIFGITVDTMTDKTKGKRSLTYGIGLQLDLKRNLEAAKHSVEVVGCPAQSSSAYQPAAASHRDGMSVVAIWSQGGESRRFELRRRIVAFFCAGQQDISESTSENTGLKITPIKVKLTQNMLPTPPSSRKRPNLTQDAYTSAVSVPMARLPDLNRRRSIAEAPRQLLPSSEQADLPLAASPVRAKAKDRASSLLDRIKAKEQAQANGDFGASSRIPKLGLLSPTRKSLKSNTVAAERERTRMAAYKRKSMLSRLPEVADALFMLFSVAATPPSPSASMPNPPTRHRKAMPLDEVCAIIAKSSKIALSEGEATSAVRLLLEIYSNFVKLSRVEGREWLAVVQPGERLNLSQCKDVIRRELILES